MLILDDCLVYLKTLEANSIDSIVTDPPYGLKFMNKHWDHDVPKVEIWTECLRVLKPGGHLLSFGGTRTYHRLAVNIEDAGFEIRDQIQWIYGSGFPKSHNIKEGEFKGWGTALKPANEPIVLARKPIEGTVAQNIEKWSCGGLNINECRIALLNNEPDLRSITNAKMACNNKSWVLANKGNKIIEVYNKEGRWPANVIFDEDAAEMLGEPSRFFYCAKASKSERNAGLEGMPEKKCPKFDGGNFIRGNNNNAKETKNENFHPTVKPIKLMEYLCKLITPPNGTILDPFMGSGSTGLAAKNLGFNFIGIEKDAEYFEIAKKRIE